MAGGWTLNQRRDNWDRDESTEAEVTAGWAALEQLELEDDSGLRAMKNAIGAQDWTPRLNFSKPGRPAAATGAYGPWAHLRHWWPESGPWQKATSW